MSSRPRIGLTQVQTDTLVLLHERFRSDQRGLSIVELAKRLAVSRNEVRLVLRDEIKGGRCQENYTGPLVPPPVPLDTVSSALAALVAMRQGVTLNQYIPPDERCVELTRSGVEFVELYSDDAYRASIEHLNRGVEAKLVVPASDRTVTIKHNQPDYQEAVAALDRVIEEFRNDHRLDNDLGCEKGALLKGLEGGRELLNDTVINVRIGTALILEPLRRLVEKYEQALVGALASAALPLVLKLLGIAG